MTGTDVVGLELLVEGETAKMMVSVQLKYGLFRTLLEIETIRFLLYLGRNRQRGFAGR